MEVLIIMLLMMIVAELALIYSRLTEEEKEKVEKKEKKDRRAIQGTFSNPLGDFYRKNKGLYVPVKPGSVMLDGDEEDEV